MRSQSAKPVVNIKHQARQVSSAQVKDLKSGQVVALPQTDQSKIRPISSVKSATNTSKRITSTSSSFGQDMMEIIPREVTFEGIQTNVRQEMIITVRNLSKQNRRIRFQQPKSTKFRVDYDVQRGIAAGLAVKILVIFETFEQINEDFHDTLVVLIEDGQKQEILIHANRKCPNITFDNSIDFGYVQVDKRIRKTLQFSNNGDQTGKITLKSDNQLQVQVEPSLFSLEGKQKTFIEIFYKPKEMGNFRSTIDVLIDGIQQSHKIDLSATCVEFNRIFIDQNGSQVSNIDFAELYMGKEKTFIGTFINNTPKGQNYHIRVRQGIIKESVTILEEYINLQTPHELGLEQCEKEISLHPNKGYIGPYQQQKIKITCKGQVNVKSQMQAKTYCYSTERQADKLILDFAYSLLFEIDQAKQSEDTLVVHVLGKQCIPLVKLSRQQLNFGECDVNDNKDILLSIENVHPFLPVDVSFAKISCFTIKPENITLKPQTNLPIYAQFTPKNVGSYVNTIDMLVIDGQFKIPIKVSGEATKIVKRRPQTRGPEAIPGDFQTQPKLVDHEILDYVKKRKNDLNDLHSGSKSVKAKAKINENNMVECYFQDSEKTTMEVKELDPDQQAKKAENIESLQQKQNNKVKYNTYLVDQRNSRLEKGRQKILFMRVDEIQNKMKEQGIEVKRFDATDAQDQDPKLSCPVDYEFEFGLGDAVINEPDLPLPTKKDGLFVIKPIEQYDPIQKNEDEKVIFKVDPTQPVKRLLSARPQSHKQGREVHQELTPQDLKKIQAGPTKIDFGTIFINTLMKRTFYVKNELRCSISCRILADKEEFKETYILPQIIESSQTAQFEISLQAQGLGQFKHTLKYIINEKYTFEFLVCANVESVSLEISKLQVKFNFSEENTNFNTTEVIKLTNKGSGPAQYKWVLNENTKFFTIQYIKGYVPAESTINIPIIYTPSNIMKNPEDPQSDNVFNSLKVRDTSNRFDEEKIILKVTDGQEQQIKCIGTVLDPKCVLKSSTTELGQVAVCTKNKSEFQIKNTSRFPAVFKVLTDKLPYQCIVNPTIGRILAEETKDFTVQFESTTERSVQSEILVMLKCGRVIRVPFSVQCIVPQIVIEQSYFDFGRVTTQGNQGTLPMTIKNNSNIKADLIFDLRHEEQNPAMQEGVQYLQIIQVENLDKVMLKSIHEDDEAEIRKSVDSKEEEEEDDQEALNNSRVNEHEKQTNKKLTLKVEPNQRINFELKMCPKEIRKFQFQIPAILAKYGPIPGLTRTITCVASRPRFIVEPQIVDFGRKILLTPIEKNTPVIQEVILSNPETTSVAFKIDDSTLLNDKIYQIVPNVGRVDPGQTLRLKIMFNPKLSGEYNKNLPIFIEEQQQTKPYLILQLSGIAAKPRLLFDRREVILPPVPLNIISSTQFKILNDGFQNMKLISKPIQNFQVGFLNDESTVGITRPQLSIIVTFQSPKPISITQILELVDENQQTYSIPVSATADNCILTNFPYLISHEGQYIIGVQTPQDHFKSPLALTELAQEESYMDQEDNLTVGSPSNKKKTQTKMYTQVSFKEEGVTKEAIKSGHDVMSLDELKYECEHIRGWLNYFVLNNPIDNFPQSVVECHGNQIFELISFLAVKPLFPYRVASNLNETKQRLEKVTQLYNQYKELVLQLMTEGALLNHIRPHFLLSYLDYCFYVKEMEAQSKQNLLTHASLIKMSQQKYERAQMFSYLALVLQILKLYYLPRVTFKHLKSSCPNLSVFDSYVSQSNVYAPQETLLIRWVESQLDVFHSFSNIGQQNQPHRLSSMTTPFKDGHVLATLALSYIGQGAQKYFAQLGTQAKIIGKQDIENNIQKLTKAFSDVGLQTHLTRENFLHLDHVESLLLLLTLFNTLPNYIPRGQPVLFSCTLGSQVIKTIELKNPTNKTIIYWVKLEGSSDFTLEEEDSFKIDPNQTIKYKVKFNSRVSEEQQARITFINKKDSNMIVGALVFDLKGQILGRVSEKVWTVSSMLYEPKEFSIQIINKFQTSEFGNFTITVQSVNVPAPKLPTEISEGSKLKKKKSTMVSSGEKSKKELEEEHKKEKEMALKAQIEPFPSFFCKQENIRLKRGASYNLAMQFIPLIYCQQKCYVIFSDTSVGEFQYEILGNVSPPEIFLDIKPNIQVFLDTPTNYTHHIPLNNPFLRKARRLVEQQLIDRRKQGSISLNRQLSLKSLTQKKQVIPGSLQQENTFVVLRDDEETIKDILLIQTEKIFQINNYKLAQQQQHQSKQIKTQTKSPDDEDNNNGQIEEDEDDLKLTVDEDDLKIATDSTQNLMTFQFNFKNSVKDFIQFFTLVNNDRSDVRRIRISVTSLPKPVKATIEFKCPARESLIQEIPIMNATDRDFYIKTLLTGDAEKNFTCFQIIQQHANQPQQNQTSSQKEATTGQQQSQSLKKQTNKDQIIKKKTNGAISIVFIPKWVCQAEAKLTLFNALTNDQYEYDLRGVGEEPLSEGHITLTCLARQTRFHNIPITNSTEKPLQYTVQTDLINASGAPTFTVSPMKTENYTLVLTPMISGSYTGQITFTDDETGQYIWFTLTLETESPKCESIIDLVAPVRKAVAFDIELSNPLSENVTFEVIVNGEGLQGDAWFPILPGTSSTYQLIFQPLKEGKNKGNIAFIHSKMGEIWYELNLVGEDRGGIRLPQFKSELGKVDRQEIILENPLGKEVQIKPTLTNSINYALHHTLKDFILPPYSQNPVYIQFTPSSIGVQQAEIILTTSEIGKWFFICYGLGETPTPYEEKQIYCKIGMAQTAQVEWKNPMKDQIHLSLQMICEDNESEIAFQFLKKKIDRITVQGGANIQIPYQFTPQEIRKYKCNIQLTMTEKIKWIFPIIGLTESATTNVLKNYQFKKTVQYIRTKCRIPYRNQIKLILPGLSLSTKEDIFQFEILDSSDNQKIIKRWLKIQLTKNYIDNVDEPLIFDIQFTPMKPFKQQFELLVKRKSGGIWKFKFSLVADDPEVDDTIVLESKLQKISYITFKITNRIDQFSPFQAFFTPDSNPEFSIEPKSGLLEPYGKSGTEFKIGFKPKEYGKRQQGKLVIQTENMMWSYAVRGHLPQYQPPQVKQTQIDNHLQQNAKDKLKHEDNKNYLLENMKISPPRQRQTSPNEKNLNKTKLKQTNLQQLNSQK